MKLRRAAAGEWLNAVPETNTQEPYSEICLPGRPAFSPHHQAAGDIECYVVTLSMVDLKMQTAGRACGPRPHV